MLFDQAVFFINIRMDNILHNCYSVLAYRINHFHVDTNRDGLHDQFALNVPHVSRFTFFYLKILRFTLTEVSQMTPPHVCSPHVYLLCRASVFHGVAVGAAPRQIGISSREREMNQIRSSP